MSDDAHTEPAEPVLTLAELETLFADENKKLVERVDQLTAVAHDLDADRRRQLAEIVIHCDAAYQLWTRRPDAEKWFRAEAKFGRGQRKRLTDKIKTAIAAVEEALMCASKVGRPDADKNELLARRVRGLALPQLEAALKALRSVPLDSSGFWTPATQLTPLGKLAISYPTVRATEALVKFFTESCGLTRSQASQRTARIGNALWQWNIKERDNHESANPERSRAVLRRIARHAKRRTRAVKPR